MASEYRTFAGEIRTLAKKNEFLYDVEIWLLNDKVNRNGWKYINIEANKAQFAGTPILVAYLGNGAVIGDGHNYKMVPDAKTKTIRPSFTEPDAERIVGSLSDRPEDIRMEERDGNKWVVGRGSLWRFYAPELVDKIENDAMQGHTMSISIETLVTKSHMEEDVEIEEEYQIIHREIDNGAKGVIVEMCDSSNYTDDSAVEIGSDKMILVETDVEAEGMYAAILPQSYEMGEAVAEAVIADYGENQSYPA